MKKIFLLLLAVVALSVILPMTYAFAADVPDFRRVAGNYVTDGERVNSRKGYRVYAYECAVNQYDYLGDQYVQLLLESGLSYMGHEPKDFTRSSSAMYIDKWFFNCRGQRVEFWRVKYYGEGRTSFSVRVANGLSYEGY